jgi:hypothetical protein
MSTQIAVRIPDELIVQLDLLVRRMGSLGPPRAGDLGNAVRAAVDC